MRQVGVPLGVHFSLHYCCQVIAADSPSMRSLDSRLKESMTPGKKRVKRSWAESRMSEEKATLRKATVELITNEECKDKLEGKFKVKPVHLCAFTPGLGY